MASTDPDKRSKLIDELLERKEFSEIWVNKWAELLQVTTVEPGQLQGDVPLLQLAGREALQEHADGPDGPGAARAPAAARSRTPATNFYQITTETLPLTENVAQVFMGMRIQCAQCHNHPFDRWTQNDYYGFAAFFAQIGRKQGEDYRETIVFNSGGGEVRHPVGGRVMKPKFLGGEVPDVAGKDRRVVLAKWLASPQNPWFATSFANRVWAHFMGVGHRRAGRRLPRQQPGVEPRAARSPGQAVHRLEVRPQGPGPRHLQLADLPAHDPAQREQRERRAELRPRQLVRRIKAENLLDTISAVTDTKDKFEGLPLGARAVQIADGSASTYFLTTFGRATRETVCSCEVKMEPTLSQALHLLNGDTVNAKIQQGGRDPQADRRPRSSPRSGSSSSTSACLSRKPTKRGARQAPARSRRGLEPGAGARRHLLGPAQ